MEREGKEGNENGTLGFSDVGKWVEMNKKLVDNVIDLSEKKLKGMFDLMIYQNAVELLV